MPTLLRIWSRARRPVTKAWESSNPSSLVWGLGPGRSSSDSAYELNLAKEQASLKGWESLQAALGLWKAYEMVDPKAQMREARALRFPLRLTWMLLSTYRLPRCLKAFGSLSRSLVAWQGNIAGCGHANSLLLVLTLKALQRGYEMAPTVTPRALVDDVTLDWQGPDVSGCKGMKVALESITSSFQDLKLVMQPAKCGYLASSRKMALAFRPYGQKLKLA